MKKTVPWLWTQIKKEFSQHSFVYGLGLGFLFLAFVYGPIVDWWFAHHHY